VQALPSNGDSGGVECRRDTLIEAEKGQQLNLRASIKHRENLSNQTERCSFVFEHAKEEFQCCFGTAQGCLHLFSSGYNQTKKSEERCQSLDVVMDKDIVRHSSCSANISSVNKAHAGLYKVFNSEGDLVQACHLEVIVSNWNPWKVPFFVVNSIMLCLLACALILAKKLIDEKRMKKHVLLPL